MLRRSWLTKIDYNIYIYIYIYILTTLSPAQQSWCAFVVCSVWVVVLVRLLAHPSAYPSLRLSQAQPGQQEQNTTQFLVKLDRLTEQGSFADMVGATIRRPVSPFFKAKVVDKDKAFVL